MGAVYKARDLELDRTVALKLIRADFASDPDASQRFKQELLLASKITHRNVLRIHDLGEAGDTKFISMAYVEGADLHQVLKAEGKLGIERALHIARQLCAALEAAHAEGVVHRDLKPQNILLDTSDNVYVSDFGLAKSLEHDSGMTMTGAVLGTPKYMAPEQVDGKKLDHRADLYALGLILYEMVTGEIPFQAKSTPLLMLQRIQETPRSPKTLNPEVPDWLAAVILKCLERHPEQRYGSAREILQDIEAAAAPRSARHGRSLQVELPIPAGRKIIIVAVALVVMIAGAYPLWRMLHRAGPSTQKLPSLSQGKYIAILPFRVLGDEQELRYAADGLVEALSAKLFHVSGVHLAADSEVHKAAKNKSIDEVAHVLGANLILQATVQGSGDKIRVTTTLDDMTSGRRLWTDEFSGPKQDLLTLEDQMFARMAAALDVKQSTEEQAATVAHPTENIAAYDSYLRGREAMRNQLNVQSVQAAVGYFEDALKKDSQFALAYAGLADASLRMYTEKKDRLWADKALAAAQQAQQLNSNLPEVHVALGAAYNSTGRTAEGVAELKRAVELAPNSDDGWRRLGDAYRVGGRKENALEAYNKAIEINPYYWFNYNARAGACLHFGDNEQALKDYQKAAELAPGEPAPYRNIGVVYMRKGDWQACIAPLTKALTIEPNYAAYSNLGTAYFYMKRYSDAVANFEKAVGIVPNQVVAVGNLADAYRWSGKSADAVKTYDRAIALAIQDLQVNPRSASTMGSLALYYAKKGESQQALEYIRRARTINGKEVELIYIEGVVNALAGRDQDALRALRVSFEQGYPASEAKNDPELAALDRNTQFRQLLAEFSRK